MAHGAGDAAAAAPGEAAVVVAAGAVGAGGSAEEQAQALLHGLGTARSHALADLEAHRKELQRQQKEAAKQVKVQKKFEKRLMDKACKNLSAEQMM